MPTHAMAPHGNAHWSPCLSGCRSLGAIVTIHGNCGAVGRIGPVGGAAGGVVLSSGIQRGSVGVSG